jgi:hypothetical protein
VGGLFSPASLFAAGEQGWWYDPSNMSTLFQNSAGTTPVTAMEQPVGLQLDLSKGLVLVPELVTNGDFSDGTTGWTIGATITAVSVVDGELQFTGSGNLNATNSNWFSQVVFEAEDFKRYVVEFDARWISGGNLQAGAGFNLVRTIQPNTSLTRYSFVTGRGAAGGGDLRQRVTFSADSGAVWRIDNISVRELPGNHRFQTTSANRPVVSARVNLFVGTATLATQSVTTRATTHTLTFTGAGSITLTGTAIGVYTAGTHSVTTTAGSLTATVLGTVTEADLRATNVGVGLPAYQAVVTSTNYDSTGFPVYIKPNGSNQFMQTNSINFTATDKMTVWQGVRKLSDAATAILMELSASTTVNTGVFAIPAPTGSNDRYGFNSKGTALASTFAIGYTPPTTNVLTGIGDISGDVATLRIDGAQVNQSTDDQGTGNYGNYPAYFYARNGASAFFNGHDYGSIARGAASTAAQIANGETYINKLTKAYTP